MQIKIISKHSEYTKGQVLNLDKNIAIPLLTNGKAIRVFTEVAKKTEASKETKSKK